MGFQAQGNAGKRENSEAVVYDAGDAGRGRDILMDTLKGKQIMVWTFMGNTRMYQAFRDYGDRISQIGLFSFKVRATGEIYESGVSIAEGSTMG